MIRIYSLQIFDIFQLQVADKPLSRFATERGQALLAYFLLNGDQVHTREALAELLWPDRPGKQSRQNLRQTLSRMRQDLCAGGLADPFQSDYHTIRLDASRFTVDALHFDALLASCKTHPHSALEHCPHCAEQLRQAVALYRGDLLAGLTVNDSPLFEEWLLLQREVYHRRAVDALQTLITYHRNLRDHAAVQRFATQLIGLEPYQEMAYFHLIEALALLGERSAALAAYERCVAMLADELGVTPGERVIQLYSQLTQFGETEILAGEIERSLPQAGMRHHFPQFLVPFFGRQQEIAQIGARLADPECRLLTVTGPGGIGKSRLLAEAAQHLNPLDYPDGLYFVPLASISDREGVIRAIAEAVSIPLAEGTRSQLPLLRGLAPLRLLLVLDNFEHLMDAAPLVLEILEKAPGVRCLVSSRQPLQLQAEWLLPLNGLDYPAEPEDAQIEQYSAVAFFLERARRVQPDFEPSPADYQAILAICRLVNGMPLAITMAASWLSVHDCAAIAAQIGKSLDFFAVPLRDLPWRHQSMRATFEISWQLLPLSSQQLLARLSIFHGAFTYAAAQTVAAASPLDLVRLVTHSLLTRVAADRYTLHELLRQFAAEKLAELNQDEATRRAHARYYLTLLGDAEAEIRGSAQLQAIERLHADLPNLRTAWLAAAADRQWDLVQRCLKSFERFWLVAGGHAEGYQLLAVVVDHLTQDLAEQTPSSTGGNATILSLGQRRELLARVKLAQGHFAQTYAPLSEAIDVVKDALALTQKAGTVSADLMGEIHLTLSWLYHQQGSHAPGEHHLNQANARLQQSTDLALQALLFLEISKLSGLEGNEAQRRTHLEHAMALAEQSSDLHVDVTIRRYLTHMQIRWGDYARVHHHIERLLHNAQLIKNVSIEAYALNLYAGYYFQMGDFEKMSAHHGRAVPILQKSGSTQALTVYYMRQGLHSLFVRDLARAMAWSREALAFARTYHYRDTEAFALILLGRVQMASGMLDAGWHSFAQAMQQMDQHGRTRDYLAAVLGQASILHAQGNAPVAVAMIEPHLDTLLTGDLGTVIDYSHVYADAYRILHAAADPRAGDLLGRAYAVLSRVANTIPDADLRHSFWQNNPSHRFILVEELAMIGDSRQT